MATKDDTAALIAAKEASDARKAIQKAKRDGDREARAGETKADAFKRIANRRTNNVLDTIASMRGLANKTNYDYSSEQVSKVISALRSGIDQLEKDFASGGPQRNDSGFGL